MMQKEAIKPVKCEFCTKTGHQEQQCYRKTGGCFYCGATDHKIVTCIKHQRGQYRTGIQNIRTLEQDLKQLKCPFCGEPHLMKNCKYFQEVIRREMSSGKSLNEHKKQTCVIDSEHKNCEKTIKTMREEIIMLRNRLDELEKEVRLKHGVSSIEAEFARDFPKIKAWESNIGSRTQDDEEWNGIKEILENGRNLCIESPVNLINEEKLIGDIEEKKKVCADKEPESCKEKTKEIKILPNISQVNAVSVMNEEDPMKWYDCEDKIIPNTNKINTVSMVKAPQEDSMGEEKVMNSEVEKKVDVEATKRGHKHSESFKIGDLVWIRPDIALDKGLKLSKETSGPWEITQRSGKRSVCIQHIQGNGKEYKIRVDFLDTKEPMSLESIEDKLRDKEKQRKMKDIMVNFDPLCKKKF